jgi:hypothetical protein
MSFERQATPWLEQMDEHYQHRIDNGDYMSPTAKLVHDAIRAELHRRWLEEPWSKTVALAYRNSTPTDFLKRELERLRGYVRPTKPRIVRIALIEKELERRRGLLADYITAPVEVVFTKEPDIFDKFKDLINSRLDGEVVSFELEETVGSATIKLSADFN